MICRNILTKVDYNYKFIDKETVELSNVDKTEIINYKDWCKDYLIIDKWRTI